MIIQLSRNMIPDIYSNVQNVNFPNQGTCFRGKPISTLFCEMFIMSSFPKGKHHFTEIIFPGFHESIQTLTFPTRNHAFAEVCVFTLPVNVREVKFPNGKQRFAETWLSLFSGNVQTSSSLTRKRAFSGFCFITFRQNIAKANPQLGNTTLRTTFGLVWKYKWAFEILSFSRGI